MINEKKDNIWMYGLIGAGYLLFCSALPSMMAISCAEVLGADPNTIYIPLALVTGIIYMVMIFSFMGEKMELFSNFSLKGTGEAVLTAILLFVIINFVVSPALSFVFPTSAVNYDNNVTSMMSTPVATFLQVAIIAPLFEELIFRGLIL